MLQRSMVIILLFFFGNMTVSAQFLESKKDLQHFSGFFNFHYSEMEGKIYLEVPKNKIEIEFLYAHSLRTGLGSNDIGLDRGQLGDQAVVKFVKSGNQLLLMQPNLKYRAITDNVLEQKSIKEAFATSVIYGANINETNNSSYIIDISAFIMEDAHGIATRLKSKKEGSYKVDASRSSVWMERTKAFPKNVEFEALLTFKGTPSGHNIRSIAPDATSISVIQHHSFIELPDTNFKPREFHPQSGSFSIDFLDYSTPIWEPIKKRFITKHRLEKKNPLASVSEAVEPIIYYLDPGTPEPIRSALLEGASWWNQAFTAAGYKNAFQVQMLPENADPMDVRYNVIQWVHRSTRGWSYGGSILDPRTGEILKGHVSLGSLRIRQDFLIAQALMDKPFAQRDDNHNQMLQMALARIRQLSAHEIGHTLGFAHNFAASAIERSSVMDYPHPTLKRINGKVDFSNAYATGIGIWDEQTVKYTYGNAPAGTTEKEFLASVLEQSRSKGLRFISDSDARAVNGAHATAHLWDNGANAATELENVLTLRETAIKQFSVDNIRTGEAYSVLEDVFVPLYFYHRFQTEAAVKLIGGMDYNYAVKGDNQLVTTALPVSEQIEALNAVVNTLQAKALRIPENVLVLFPPRAYGYRRGRESFKSNIGVAFDAIGAAATASEMTLTLLLNPQRANRLVQQKAMNTEQLGLQVVLDHLVDRIYKSTKGSDTYIGEINRTVQFQVIQQLFNLSINSQSISQTKALAFSSLKKIQKSLKRNKDEFSIFIIQEIENFIKHPENFKQLKSPKIPDGSPIGSFNCGIFEN
ncbi:zinc-dependent metalloprotease [Patiriisocius marinus]|uniref:zinc-dependent metalloprotease n=1 Tax=Patiriisocius marinus TaxID=1397112 RepID=UPI0023311C0A|nr:zinc-dependent metalloprotease [Patiriisocius marinus]